MTVINDHKMKIPQKWQIPLSIPISESFIEKHYFFHFFSFIRLRLIKKMIIYICVLFLCIIFF